ncbi:hypothetical protein GCM10010405_05510 [Streptomyces macrosporus]|uniref:Aldehyde dehydrogenase domain-containing protein n=1 Tax=Streptomyces macrosporus TaxID=44032 RepID=A0ABN3JCN5_9ACTN
MSCYATVNPATGERVTEYPVASDQEAESSLTRAHSAYRKWRETPLRQRADVLRRVAELYRERADELARTLTLETGKPIAEAKGEVALAASIYGVPRRERRDVPGGRAARGRRRRRGDRPHRAHRGTRRDHALELPPLPGGPLRRAEHRARQHDHPQARPELPALELGGSDPFIVLDADNLDGTVAAAVKNRVYNAGQACTASKRFIVLEDVYDAFLDRFVEAMRQCLPGDPMDPTTAFGPLASRSTVDELAEQVEDAVAKGATLLVGGHRIDGPGAFHEGPSWPG